MGRFRLETMPPEGIARIADTLQKRTYQPKEDQRPNATNRAQPGPAQVPRRYRVSRTSSGSTRRARSSSSCCRAWPRPRGSEERRPERPEMRPSPQARVWVRTGPGFAPARPPPKPKLSERQRRAGIQTLQGGRSLRRAGLPAGPRPDGGGGPRAKTELRALRLALLKNAPRAAFVSAVTSVEAAAAAAAKS